MKLERPLVEMMRALVRAGHAMAPLSDLPLIIRYAYDRHRVLHQPALR